MVGAYLVTEAADSVDERWVLGEGFVELGAEIADIDFDGVGEDVGVVIPDVGDELVFGEDLVGVTHKILQEGEFFFGEGDGGAGSLDGEGEGVEGKIADREDRVEGSVGAAGESAEAGEQFGKGERLGEIVVGAGVETGDFVVQLAFGSEDEDGGVIVGLAEALADGEAVKLWEHEVKNN